MNSESAKGLLKRQNSALVCRHGKREDMCLVTSGGRFNIRRRSLALAGPPISPKNRGWVRLMGTMRLIKRLRYYHMFGSERVKSEYKKHHMITALSHYAYVDTETYHMSDS